MATTLGPKGRMTEALSTPYSRGDKVTLVDPDIMEGNQPAPHPRVGDVGTIRRIRISDPMDGDETFLVFDVRWTRGSYRGVFMVGESEIAPAASEANAWLLRQLNGLTA